MRGQILGGDSIPTLIAAFSRVMRVSTGADVSSTSSIDQSACTLDVAEVVVRDRNFGGGRSSIDTGRSFIGGRQSAPDKGPRHCKHYRRSDHISEKCWRSLVDLVGTTS